VNELLPPKLLRATLRALRALAATGLLPPDDTLGRRRGGHLPAIVHQTWKLDSGTAADFALPAELAAARARGKALAPLERARLAAWVKRTRPRRFMDAWDDNAWRHLVELLLVCLVCRWEKKQYSGGILYARFEQL
jgi:hypothetical protein